MRLAEEGTQTWKKDKAYYFRKEHRERFFRDLEKDLGLGKDVLGKPTVKDFIFLAMHNYIPYEYTIMS